MTANKLTMTKTIIKDKAIMMEQIRELIAEGKTVTLTVKGNSMNPFMVHLRDQITLGTPSRPDNSWSMERRRYKARHCCTSQGHSRQLPDSSNHTKRG